jgi:Ion channel
MDHATTPSKVVGALFRTNVPLPGDVNSSSQFWSSDDEVVGGGGSGLEHGDNRTSSVLNDTTSSVAAADPLRGGRLAVGLSALSPPPRLRGHNRQRRQRREVAQLSYPSSDDEMPNHRHGNIHRDKEINGRAAAAAVVVDDDSWSVPSEFSDARLEEQEGAAAAVPPSSQRWPHHHGHHHQQLTEHDIAMCQALDLDYERALEDRQVAWTARYQSVRQSTVVSIVFMVLLIVSGTTFFLHQADSYWSVSEGLLFSIYTITTVGYGHLDMPATEVFQLYVIFYIFAGIAMLTILVAQVYQCLALEASRVVTDAGDAHARRNSMRLWLEARARQQQQPQQQQHVTATTTPTTTTGSNQRGPQQPQHAASPNGARTPSNNSAFALDDPSYLSRWDWADVAVWWLHKWDRLRNFLRYNEFGRGVSVVLPFAFLIAIGAGVIGPLEGWSPIEATYFAVVSLTTVGFGDYYPTRTASIWFCCLWLPFSVGFMSLYLANVAAFYIRLSDRNVARIGRLLRKRLQRAKERAEQERRAVLRRAMRGQYDQRDPNLDDLTLATEAAEAAQRPLSEVQEGVTVITVEHSTSVASKKGLRQAAHRLRGFDSIPTLDDPNHVDDPSSETFAPDFDGSLGDAESPRRQQPIHRPSRNNSASRNDGGPTSYQRQRILQNSQKHMELVPKSRGSANSGKSRSRATMTMKTMKDVLRAVHRNNSLQRLDSLGNGTSPDDSTHGVDPLQAVEANAGPPLESSSRSFPAAGHESEFLSIRSNRTVLHYDRKTVRKKPSFALRALVQERFAEIIAADVAGFQSSIEIKDYTLAVTIETLKETAEKWLVPRRARRAFRAVAFEALYFVGEHGLITKGSDALFALSPFEFHEIFSPLLAAFGDAETMELWLERTQALADVDLTPPDQVRSSTKRNLQASTVEKTTGNVSLSRSRPTSIGNGDHETIERTSPLSPLSDATAASTVASASLPTSLHQPDDGEIDLPDIA